MGYRPGPWIEYTDYTLGEDSKVRCLHHSTADIYEFEFDKDRESFWVSPERWQAMVEAAKSE